MWTLRLQFLQYQRELALAGEIRLLQKLLYHRWVMLVVKSTGVGMDSIAGSNGAHALFPGVMPRQAPLSPNFLDVHPAVWAGFSLMDSGQIGITRILRLVMLFSLIGMAPAMRTM